jgi:hypothetical protein
MGLNITLVLYSDSRFMHAFQVCEIFTYITHIIKPIKLCVYEQHNTPDDY